MADTENKTTEQTNPAAEQAKAQADAEQKKQQPQQTDVKHTPYGVISESEEAKKIRSTLPTADRNKAYNNIRKYADEHGGLCEGFVDAKTGEKIVDPNTGKPYTADALISEIEYRNAAKVDEKGQVVEKASDWQINAPGIGANGSDSFNFVGSDSKTVQQKKKEEEDKKKEGSWWSRNWKWLTATIAGLAVAGGVIGWLVHRHNKNKKKKEAERKEAEKKKDENTETKLDDKSKSPEADNSKTAEADNTKTPDQAQAGQQQTTPADTNQQKQPSADSSKDTDKGTNQGGTPAQQPSSKPTDQNNQGSTSSQSAEQPKPSSPQQASGSTPSSKPTDQNNQGSTSSQSAEQPKPSSPTTDSSKGTGGTPAPKNPAQPQADSSKEQPAPPSYDSNSSNATAGKGDSSKHTSGPAVSGGTTKSRNNGSKTPTETGSSKVTEGSAASNSPTQASGGESNNPPKKVPTQANTSPTPQADRTTDSSTGGFNSNSSNALETKTEAKDSTNSTPKSEPTVEEPARAATDRGSMGANAAEQPVPPAVKQDDKSEGERRRLLDALKESGAEEITAQATEEGDHNLSKRNVRGQIDTGQRRGR